MRRIGAFSSMTSVALAIVLLLGAQTSFAHCDGMDGPVIKAAKKALETGNVNLALIWVQKKDEGVIKAAFEKTLAVRKLNPQAKGLADLYFFETLVRIHRAGEGAPYTGLKPAGRDLGPAIPAADQAIEDGSAAKLYKILSDAMDNGLHAAFRHLLAKKNFDENNVEASREYVKAYVEFIHYAERLYEAAKDPAHGYLLEMGEAEKHQDVQ